MRNFLWGDGYKVVIGTIGECEDVEPSNYADGNDLFCDGAVKYICVKDSIGKAIVKGNKYHTVEFTLAENVIFNFNCDCISAHFCKHMVAVYVALQMLIDENKINSKTDFTAVSHNLFYRVIDYNADKIHI